MIIISKTKKWKINYFIIQEGLEKKIQQQCKQFFHKPHWVISTFSLVTIFFWWIKNLNWFYYLIFSYITNLIIYLILFHFFGKNFDEKISKFAEKKFYKKFDEINLKIDENLNENFKILLNKLIKKIWPVICSNLHINNLDKGKYLNKFIVLNIFKLRNNQYPIIEQIKLLKNEQTTNGEIIILDLILTIDWSTLNNQSLISISIYNIKFTITNLHSLNAKLKLRLCLHFMYKINKKKTTSILYKTSFTLPQLPYIKNYKTSGLGYLLYFFNLDLKILSWFLNNFLCYPHVIVFYLMEKKFASNFLIQNLKKDNFFNLDLDDLNYLYNLPNNFLHRQSFINQPNHMIKENFKKKSIEKLFEKSLNENLDIKLAKFILHMSIMYCTNYPINELNSNNLSYYVRIRFGNIKLITNSNLTTELIIYWLQSFILATSKLNLPVFIALLVDQNSLTKKKSKINNSSIEFLSINQNYENNEYSDLNEFFEIKLTDNLEKFLSNFNARLYTIEFEKTKLYIRFTCFNLKIPKLNTLSLNQSIIGLPLGVLSLFINHLTFSKFLFKKQKNYLDKKCFIQIESSNQKYCFNSLNTGNIQFWKQNCFLIIFNPNLEKIKIKILIENSIDLMNNISLENSKNNQQLINTDKNYLRNELKNLKQNKNHSKLNFVSKKKAKSFLILASCSFFEYECYRPVHKKIKLNGYLQDAFLQLYYCYSELQNLEKIEKTMLDSEKNCLTIITEPH